MINKETLTKKLIETYEELIRLLSLNVPLENLILNHPNGKGDEVVATKLNMKIDNLHTTAYNLKECLYPDNNLGHIHINLFNEEEE
tara:strand:- start:250 stop:507 length:258 start_codon:yes stop_codon:yes gene_type:complete